MEVGISNIPYSICIQCVKQINYHTCFIEYHVNDPLRTYVYVLCLSPTELYISGRI